MNGNYVLDGHEPVLEPDMLTWAKSFQQADRRVGRTEVGDLEVSTVFLGIDHNWDGGPPLLFETMIFATGSRSDERGCWRYSTWDEAEAGHERVVVALREGRDPE